MGAEVKSGSNNRITHAADDDDMPEEENGGVFPIPPPSCRATSISFIVVQIQILRGFCDKERLLSNYNHEKAICEAEDEAAKAIAERGFFPFRKNPVDHRLSQLEEGIAAVDGIAEGDGSIINFVKKANRTEGLH